MSAGVREEARTIWRSELAAQELWRLQGPLSLDMSAPTGEKKEEMLRVLRFMFSEGRWDAEDLLGEATLYLPSLRLLDPVAVDDRLKNDEARRRHYLGASSVPMA